MYGLFMYLSGTPRERVWKSPETHGEALCLRRMCLRVGPYSGQLYVVCGLREESYPPPMAEPDRYVQSILHGSVPFLSCSALRG